MADIGSVTVIIHSFNSEKDIAECVESARLLTSKVHVIDMHSTDNTKSHAENAGAQVFLVKKYPYVEPVREEGIQTAQTSWVFLLDTDERITPELAQEIRELLAGATPGNVGYYKVPRKNMFAKITWLAHGEWYPDYQTRLIATSHFQSWPKAIHSTPVISGKEAYLKNPMLHYFHSDITSMVSKTIIFEDMESELLHEAKRDASTPIFFRKFFGELYRRLVRAQGFRDGTVGIMEGLYQAFSKTITYLYVYEKKKSSTLRSVS